MGPGTYGDFRNGFSVKDSQIYFRKRKQGGKFHFVPQIKDLKKKEKEIIKVQDQVNIILKG